MCLCPDGFQGDANTQCLPYECKKDEDCEANKKCSTDRVCRNPCLEQGACGINAQCRVVNRKPLCTCPPKHIGNAQIECKLGSNEECFKNPCGINAKCKDVSGSYECACPEECIGDPYRECICDNYLINLCKDKLCGTSAQCRVVNGNTQCICPSDKPIGDPTIECKYNNFI